MAFANTAIGPTQAQKIGEEIYELILSNWGNHGAAKDAGSIVYPVGSDQQLPSIAGISISPRSEVDRCVVSYNVNPLRPPIIQPANFYQLGAVGLNDQVISVDRPWFGQLNGTLAIRADASTWFTDGYLPAAAGSATFGTALNPAVFTAPTLRILLYLRGLASQPTRRSPLSFGQILAPAGAAGAQAEQLVKVLNVQGRRHIRIMLRGNTTGAGSQAIVRIGGVQSSVVGQTVGHDPVIGSPECELMAPNTLDINEAACVALDTPQVQFLTIYMARLGAASIGGAYVYVEAID